VTSSPNPEVDALDGRIEGRECPECRVPSRAVIVPRPAAAAVTVDCIEPRRASDFWLS
jgi:hypothetical protein